MSLKLTEITESSPSVKPPSVLCGFGIFSWLGSPWSMASSGHFDPSQLDDEYKAVEVLDLAFTEFLKKGRQCFQHYNHRSSKFHHCFVGKKPCQFPGTPLSNVRWQREVERWTNAGGLIPTGGRPIYSSSEVPISMTNYQGVVKRIRRTANSPTNTDSEESDKLDSEEVEVMNPSIGHHSRTSPSQPAAKIFQSQPVLVSPMRPSPIPQPRHSPMVTYQQLKPVSSSSRRREDQLPLPFPAAQLFQREHWPVQVTREDPNIENEGQDAVARLFRRVDRNSGEVSSYSNDRIIAGIASEEMAAKFIWYEYELINDFQ
ncbi:hypothetical protein O181_080825 [Austropuccinia psidii MF-1]|uniref:Uncharacterized protein n=1 Tax=Austropuccinia psidii MF-1 TaxID=1389203 RepID=A0A9Q3FHQ8_9BASI|nr:hypothetical protein [Austropuccinia psidii MF-1]